MSTIPLQRIGRKRFAELPFPQIYVFWYEHPLKMEQPGSVSNGEHTVDIARESSFSIPDVSSISKMFKLNILVETCLVLLITFVEIVASAVVLALAKHENPHKPLRAWIVGYLSVCVAFLPLNYLDYRVKKAICDTIIPENGSDDSDDRVDSSDKFFRLALPLECLKWVFACFYFVWFVIGCVWVTKGSSSRMEAPLLFWLCVAFLIYRGLGYALQIITYVFQCCSAVISMCTLNHS